MSAPHKKQDFLEKIRSFAGNQAIQSYIAAHEKNDIKALSLQKLPDSSWPRILILDQIKSRQIAQRKIFQWCDIEGIVFPDADLMEQCSSIATARYKASLVSGQSFVDLTAGAGVDSAAFAHVFGAGVCVEKDEKSSAYLTHNMPLLTQTPVEIINISAEDFVAGLAEESSHYDFAYIDPQRRTGSGKRGLIGFELMQPDVTSLLPTLRGKVNVVMVKSGPALDLKKACDELQNVTAIHVVEWQGRCREVLYILSGDGLGFQDIPITAVELDDKGAVLHQFTYTHADNDAAQISFTAPQDYIYEPSAAFMKAGGFHAMAKYYDLNKLHPNTHLYTDTKLLPDFPGRVFKLQDVLPPDRKVLKKVLPAQKANLAARNFPQHVDKIKEKLNIRDGGTEYLFACTLHDGKHVLLRCQKV